MPEGSGVRPTTSSTSKGPSPNLEDFQANSPKPNSDTMGLVGYSDSEGSDAEPDTTPAPQITKARKVDRNSSRRIRMAIPEIKPEHPSGEDPQDGPRKKARLGEGGLAGFNSFLPAPKRTAEKKPVATTRKAFSLKTGAGPGFDRSADAEMRNDHAFENLAGDANTTSTPSSSKPDTASDTPETITNPVEIKLQGNPMMFRPLSVGRPQKKRKTTKIAEQPTPSSSAVPKPAQPLQQAPAPAAAPAPAPPKPKVSLFSLSSETTSQPDPAPGPTATYQPLVYKAEGEEDPAAGPVLAEPTQFPIDHPPATVSANPTSSLDSIANDLNLSKSERRQLFGRNANAISSQSQVRTFNTDEEYASNKVLAEGELAGAQHNPVRAIAPGKHTLQQLLNVASSQKDALEESFATGRRNKKEAGSKYGW